MAKVVKNPNAWLIAAVLGIPNAILGGWTAMMGDFLPKLCFDHECLSQEWVDILNIICNIASAIGAVLVARYVKNYIFLKKLFTRVKVKLFMG